MAALQEIETQAMRLEQAERALLVLNI